jgi:AmmeMemoRadiSam system protein B
MALRKAAVAGSWYPAAAPALAAAVDGYLARVPAAPGPARLAALVAPHAGLIYSGPVAAHAYGLLRGRPIDTLVLVGPSHFMAFDGVALYAGEGFDTPLGPAPIDRDVAAACAAAAPFVRADAAPHEREHSLEMQLPFVRRTAPAAAIVPLLMGRQTAAAAEQLSDVLAACLRGRNAVMVASTDLSHYHDAAAARRLDDVVVDCVRRFDADRLQRALDARPEHACGGGPLVAVMRAARQLGACDAEILEYADSGDVSGDKSAVVGYLAAALGSR